VDDKAAELAELNDWLVPYELTKVERLDGEQPVYFLTGLARVRVSHRQLLRGDELQAKLFEATGRVWGRYGRDQIEKTARLVHNASVPVEVSDEETPEGIARDLLERYLRNKPPTTEPEDGSDYPWCDEEDLVHVKTQALQTFSQTALGKPLSNGRVSELLRALGAQYVRPNHGRSRTTSRGWAVKFDHDCERVTTDATEGLENAQASDSLTPRRLHVVSPQVRVVDPYESDGPESSDSRLTRLTHPRWAEAT
jgi:hypothetical protein